MLNYVMLVSRQGTSLLLSYQCRMLFMADCLAALGKVRLAKWFQTLPAKTKNKIVKDVTQLVLARRTRMCNFLEYKGELATFLAGISFFPFVSLYEFINPLRPYRDEKTTGLNESSKGADEYHLYRHQSYLQTLCEPILHHLHFTG